MTVWVDVTHRGMSPNLRLQASHPDTVPSEPVESFELIVIAPVERSELPRFTGVDAATLVVDDSVEIRLGGVHEVRFLGESLTFQVSHDQALALGAARSVQGRIGSWEFRLTPWEIASTVKLLAYARLDPAAPVPERYGWLLPGEWAGQGRLGGSPVP